MALDTQYSFGWRFGWFFSLRVQDPTYQHGINTLHVLRDWSQRGFRSENAVTSGSDLVEPLESWIPVAVAGFIVMAPPTPVPMGDRHPEQTRTLFMFNQGATCHAAKNSDRCPQAGRSTLLPTGPLGVSACGTAGVGGGAGRVLPMHRLAGRRGLHARAPRLHRFERGPRLEPVDW